MMETSLSRFLSFVVGFEIGFEIGSEIGFDFPNATKFVVNREMDFLSSQVITGLS